MIIVQNDIRTENRIKEWASDSCRRPIETDTNGAVPFDSRMYASGRGEGALMDYSLR